MKKVRKRRRKLLNHLGKAIKRAKQLQMNRTVRELEDIRTRVKVDTRPR